MQPLGNNKYTYILGHTKLTLICMHQFSLSYLSNQFQHVTTLFTQHALSGFTIQAFTFWLFSSNKCLPFVVLCPNLNIHNAFYCMLVHFLSSLL